jgi:UDP-glucose:(heptosyl)LPS alpha-1,3-glucosyltransferase
MKIAIVSIRFDTKGGSERRTYQLARGLVNAGHQVEIFANTVEDMDLNAKVNIVPMMMGPSFVKVMSFKRNVNRILAGRQDLDVVHNQIRPFTDGIVTIGGGCHAEYLEQKGGFSGSVNPLNHVVLKMERERYRQGGCRAVIAISEYVKKGILRYYPMPPEKIFVAYNGVDSVKFHPDNAGRYRADVRARLGYGDEPVVLFIGSGFKRKGLETIIRALSVVKGMDREINRLKLLVVSKDDKGPYERLAGRLGVTERVKFVSPTTRPEMYFGASDIFALPTKYEPFSNSALEAMASGLPVVTTAHAGVSELITDGENGFVMRKPDDYLDLSATLAYLSCEKARKQVGEKARKTAECFTWEKTLNRTLEVYRVAYNVG